MQITLKKVLKRRLVIGILRHYNVEMSRLVQYRNYADKIAKENPDQDQELLQGLISFLTVIICLTRQNNGRVVVLKR